MEIEIDTIQAAKAGNKEAENEIYSQLAVRFLSLITWKVQKHPILSKWININEKCHEVSDYSLKKIKEIYPIDNPDWKLRKAISILCNIVDDFITNALTDMAKSGESEAENLLFSIVREKLIERVDKKRWGFFRNELKDE